MTANIFWVGFFLATLTGLAGFIGRLSLAATALVAGCGFVMMAGAIAHG